MKAIQLHGRGGTESLFYEDAPEPILLDGEVLVRVHACAITKAELFWKPVHIAENGQEREFVIPGHEISGTVEKVAEDVEGFNLGHSVYSLVNFDRTGGAAEFVAVPAKDLALKPHSINFIQGAAVPLAAMTAWQGLFDHAGLSSNQKILIHGAAGGVGSFAVQFAHWAGAYVICTALGTDEELLKSLGANEVIDYTEEKFEEIVNDIDIVFDTVGEEMFKKSWQVIKPGGALVTIYTNSDDSNPIADADLYGVRGIYFIVKPNSHQLTRIGQLIDDGIVRPLIDSVFPLSEGRAAFEKAINGPNHGKIVLQID